MSIVRFRAARKNISEVAGLTGEDDLQAGPGVASLNRGDLHRVFVQAREDLVRFLTRRTGNPAIAADLCHDVFEKLDTVRAQIPTPQKARSYLFRMASNLAIDHQRGERRRAEILDGSHILFEDVVHTPEEITVSREELRQVEKALAELPPRVAEVLILKRMHNFRHKEIAARLGISVSLVEKYQLRALTHCRKRLGADHK